MHVLRRYPVVRICVYVSSGNRLNRERSSALEVGSYRHFLLRLRLGYAFDRLTKTDEVPDTQEANNQEAHTVDTQTTRNGPRYLTLSLGMSAGRPGDIASAYFS